VPEDHTLNPAQVLFPDEQNAAELASIIEQGGVVYLLWRYRRLVLFGIAGDDSVTHISKS